MTPDELKGKTQQAVKQARAALEASAKANACTPEAHREIVEYARASLDINEAQSEYLGNGLSETIAERVAQKVRERKPITVNGKEIPIPSGSTIWRTIILISILVPAFINGCRSNTPPNVAKGVQAAQQIVLDPNTIALLKILLPPAGVTNAP